MLGFYRKGNFIDWIGLRWVLLVCGRVGVFFAGCMRVGLGFSKFVNCKGRRDGICGEWIEESKRACKEFFGFGVDWRLGRGMEWQSWDWFLYVFMWLVEAGYSS